MDKLQKIDIMLGFGGFEYVVLLINVLLFLFSRRIVGSTYRSLDENSFTARLWVLRVISLVLIALYLSAAFFTEHARQISETGLVILLAYLSVHFSQVFLLNRYGRLKEIDGVEYRSETYQSEIFGLIIFLVAAITAFLVIINIWGMTSWLQATSVLGGLLVVLFSTKDVWVPDNINGLILLYNRDVEPGCVVKVDEHQLMAIVLKISLTQITLRDLAHRYLILMPNSRFRNSKIEVLSAAPASGLEQYVDFNIGYSVSGDQVEAMLLKVWETATENEKCLNAEKTPRIRLVNTGDHAVVWRLYYTVANVYRLFEAKFAINHAAFNVSTKMGVALQTPLTHEVLSYELNTKK
ncbi:MAG: mechanosensitive ion channel [Gammaproteobacteria bacterium]|nr:mechanosensitive ion channel [Gammaproteobacteria bacterium]